MGIRFTFDAGKAVEVLLYIAGQQPDMYAALKILYFADRQHLARYGRFICGDSYIAMDKGPVPSGAYDLVKFVRGNGWCAPSVSVKEAFAVQGYSIIPLRKPNLDLLSESDIECLDEAIRTYGNWPFGKLKRESHDKAYLAADANSVISVEAIARTLPDGELLIEHLTDD